MNIKFFKKHKVSLPVLFFVGIVLIGFALFYFIFFKVRSRATLYLSLVLARSMNISNVPPYWVPYWIDNSIKIGDKEVNPLGQTDLLVVDKESFEDRQYGDYVNLTVKINAVKNRAGGYLYKNKPIVVGSIIELNLTNTQVYALVVSTNTSIPKYKYQQITFQSEFKEIEPWLADMVKVGSIIKNNKGIIIARLVDKKVTFAQVTADTASGTVVIGQNRLKRDMVTTVEILAKVIDGVSYFQDTQKVKGNENIYLPWQEGELYHHINKIISVEDVK